MKIKLNVCPKEEKSIKFWEEKMKIIHGKLTSPKETWVVGEELTTYLNTYYKNSNSGIVLDLILDLYDEAPKRAKKHCSEFSSDEFPKMFPNYKFSEDEISCCYMYLPSLKNLKNFSEYLEQIRNDKKYVDVKELITEIQKSIVKSSKNNKLVGFENRLKKEQDYNWETKEEKEK